MVEEASSIFRAVLEFISLSAEKINPLRKFLSHTHTHTSSTVNQLHAWTCRYWLDWSVNAVRTLTVCHQWNENDCIIGIDFVVSALLQAVNTTPALRALYQHQQGLLLLSAPPLGIRKTTKMSTWEAFLRHLSHKRNWHAVKGRLEEPTHKKIHNFSVNYECSTSPSLSVPVL